MRLKITQYRSTNRRSHDQRETVRALGFRRLHQEVIHEDCPQIRGMIRKVAHLVRVQELTD
jgi:large subunit ribosomal protein L30